MNPIEFMKANGLDPEDYKARTKQVTAPTKISESVMNAL